MTAIALKATPKLAALPPLSLYIHIPWCVRKCPYCDFNSHEIKPATPGVAPVTFLRDRHAMPALPEREYIDALVADLEAALPTVWGRRVHTIFFGGGTPSVFSAAAIDEILAAVRARLPLDADAEITLEANPGTVEADRFAGYRAAGVNRLSLGIQSFNDAHLAALGRIHGSAEALAAIDIAQRHFDNINLDLMFALPGQSLADCEADVARALAAGTRHLSIYHLTLEPNTLFHAFPPPLPDDELAADMQQHVFEATAAAGFTHYETSAFARPGHESRHNLNYWRFGDYLGIGAGAHGKISFPDRITREAKEKQPAAYMKAALAGNAMQESRVVAPGELPFEFMLNALRLNAGFPLALFTERTGLPVTAITATLDRAEAKGLLARDHLMVRPTEKGRMFLNDLLEMFLA